MMVIKKNRIKELLVKNDKTITDMAKEIDVCTKTIYNIIDKKNSPKLNLAKSIAKYFKVNMDDVFEFEEEYKH